MKKFFIAAAGLGLLAALLWWWAPAPVKTAETSAPAPPAAREAPLAPMVPLVKSPAPAASRDLLNAETRAAIRECLGEELADWAALSRAVDKLAAPGKRALQWRVMQTEEEGRAVRLRLTREARESGDEVLSLQRFSVDEDGLPDALPPVPGQRENPVGWLSEYLRGKILGQDSRLEEITLPDGRTLSLESEGREITEAQFHGPGLSLACSRKGESPGCRCLR